ncbi:MAG: alpha/beta hydrolase-fold protein [Myxococcota bacterium]
MRLFAAVLALAMFDGTCARPHAMEVWPTPLEGVALHDEGARVQAPGVHVRTYTFEGLWVAEAVLGDVSPDASLPLALHLHGRADRPRIPGGPFERLSPVRVLVPRGPHRVGDGYAWARSSVTENRHDELAADLVDVTERLSRLIAFVERRRGTVGVPVATGFSQGGMVAWTMAVRHPDRVGLALPIAGWVPPRARPTGVRPVPVKAMHGTADRIVPIALTRDFVSEQRGAGHDVAWREFDGVGHEVTPAMDRQFGAWLREALSTAPRHRP